MESLGYFGDGENIVTLHLKTVRVNNIKSRCSSIIIVKIRSWEGQKDSVVFLA